MAAPRFRAKASRSTYRRAGLVLGSADWSPEFTLDDIGVSRMAILAGDPVVTLQGNRSGDWEIIPAAARAEFASASLQVVDPDPTAEGGPSWADVEAAREETAELSRQVVTALQGEVSQRDTLIATMRSEHAQALATAKADLSKLQKQVDGLKASLTAAKAAKGKPAPATEKGPVDPPAGDPPA